jgi:hypothetical protein
MEVRLSSSWKLSTDHPSSMGGKPVLVNRATGKAYQPGDFVKVHPSWHLSHAAPAVRVLAERKRLDDDGKKLVSKFLANWPRGRRVY